MPYSITSSSKLLRLNTAQMQQVHQHHYATTSCWLDFWFGVYSGRQAYAIGVTRATSEENGDRKDERSDFQDEERSLKLLIHAYSEAFGRYKVAIGCAR